jgi:hypothetical protein
MPKKKEQKKKDRERRVAQKKHAEATKRAEEKSAETTSGFPKSNVFTGSVSLPQQKPKPIAPKTQKPFNFRRSGGG